MEPRISLITLGVRDLTRAVAFYTDVLEFPLDSASSDEIAFFQLGGLVLALYPRHFLAEDAKVPDRDPDLTGEPRFSGFALAHNVRARYDVDALLEEIVAGGGTLLRPAHDATWGGRSGYFADPDGHTWEVAWNPNFPIAADGTVRLP